MRHQGRAVATRSLFIALLGALVLPAYADVPLASREADRQAKSAAPSTSEAFIYVYRGEDSNAAPIAVTLVGRDTARLAPRTFGFWKVAPGRVELTLERSASTLPLQADRGRVYYVELTRTSAGVPTLRVVSFATGRIQVYRGQLVAQTKEPPRTKAASARSEPTPRYPGATNGAIMFKLGSFALAQPNQTILGAARTFDKSASSVFGVEGEWFIRPDISLGGELFRYSANFASSGGTLPGSVDTTAFLVNAKRYFLPDSAWQPFVGAGLGAVASSFSGSITGNVGGVALQAVGGVQWRANQFAARLEYKYLRGKTKDDNGEQVDMSGSGIFLSAGFYF